MLGTAYIIKRDKILIDKKLRDKLTLSLHTHISKWLIRMPRTSFNPSTAVNQQVILSLDKHMAE